MKTVWLTLSKANPAYEKILFLKDIFQTLNPATSQYEPIHPQDLWMSLSKLGIEIHPLLVKKHLEQQTCIFCGGMIIRIEGLTPDRYEERCSVCNYLFSEDSGK